MPSTFDNRLADALNTPLFDELGVSATHTSRAGVATACTVILDIQNQGGMVERLTDTLLTSETTGTVMVRASEVATVAVGEQFAIDGDTWAVDERQPPVLDRELWVCGVKMSEFRRMTPRRLTA